MTAPQSAEASQVEVLAGEVRGNAFLRVPVERPPHDGSAFQPGSVTCSIE